MRRPMKILAFAIPMTVACAAVAQINPLSRSSLLPAIPHGVGSAPANAILASPLGNSKPIAAPSSSFGPLSPVPEPSEWAMLVAGLALVGLIVQRNVKGP